MGPNCLCTTLLGGLAAIAAVGEAVKLERTIVVRIVSLSWSIYKDSVSYTHLWQEKLINADNLHYTSVSYTHLWQEKLINAVCARMELYDKLSE